jgi:NAD(P)-dependent dehydrogenase (short-subunit alcohol dehydrogenase family)
MQTMNGKVVLVTGAGRGMGRELSLALAAHGARVALNDISPLNVDEVAQQISTNGVGQARVYLHDIAKKVAVQTLVNQMVDDFGCIDILINNANVEPDATLLNMDEWDLHRVFEVNTIGTFLSMQSVGRVMREQGQGFIVNLLGRLEHTEKSPTPAYFSSRLAVAGLTWQSAAELAGHGIRVYGLGCGLGLLSAAAPLFTNAAQAVLDLYNSQDVPTGSILNIC